MGMTAVNHAGLTTPDIFGAIDWYGSQFGLRLIMGPRVLDATASPETRQIYGEEFGKAYQAHLLGADGFGLELFQFVEPPVEEAEDGYDYTRRGFSHVCFTVAELDEAVVRVQAAGGSLISPPAEFVPGRPWRLAYCRDPWSSVIELMSHTYAECFANWPQPGAEAQTQLLHRASGGG